MPYTARALIAATLVAMAFSTLTLVGAEDDPLAISVFGWNYGRARKTVKASNVVTGMFTLKNITKKDLPSVTVTLQFTTGVGEKINEPVSTVVGPMKAGETKKVSLEQNFVPAFSGYDVIVEYGTTKELWYGSGDQGQPQPKNGAPVPGVASVLVLGQDVTTEKSGKFGGTIRVKNEGTIEASDVKITATFFDANKKKISEWSGKLGDGKLAANTEKNIPFTVPNVPPNQRGYELRVGCADTSSEAALSGGEFTTAEEVEFANFDFKRPNPKGDELSVAAKVRNGFKVPVDAAQITLVFMSGKKKELKRHTFIVPGQLKPGEIKPISFTIPAIPQYEAFEQQVTYKCLTANAPGESKPASQSATASFKGGPEVEVIFIENAVNDDQSVSFVGAARNGKEQPVQDITVSLVVKKGGKDLKFEKVLSGVMKHGEERNFIVKAPDASGFDSFNFSFKFSSVK